MVIRVSIVAALLLSSVTPLQAGTLNVPGDAATIQGAIAMANSGDTILVGPGTYVETIDFLGKQLVVEGTGGAAVTTIDAAGRGSVVTLAGLEPAGTALRGFTLTGGTGQELWSGGALGGGGVCIRQSAHLDLSECVITGNTADSAQDGRGGGVMIIQGVFQEVPPVSLTDCILTANAAQRGAAVYASGSRIDLRRCTISGNTVLPGLVVDNMDAAVAGTQSWLTLADCQITDNIGDGVFASSLFWMSGASNCVVSGNSGWGYVGFGVYPELSGCRFLGNGLGGASILAGGQANSGVTVRGCVFAGGDVLKTQSGLVGYLDLDRCSFDGTQVQCASVWELTVRSCIARGGQPWIVGDVEESSVTYSDIEGGAPGTGNIDADPQWVNAAAHDYRLLPSSPCIDTGDPASPLDPDGTRADMGAIPFENAFDDLGGGVPGTAGPVVLAAHSTLVGGDSVVFKLSGTAPFQSTLLILGASQLGAPFKGGTLWPNPNALIGLMTNGSGQLTLGTTWPPTIPSGFSLWAQFWHPDAGAVAGFAGSNGVRGTTP